MEDFSRNVASPTSIKGSTTKQRSQSDLMQKMRFLRGKENEYQQETPKKHFMSPTLSTSSKTRKKLSLMERNEVEEEYVSGTFSSSSKFKKNVFIEKNEDYTVSIYTCEESSASCRHPLSPARPIDSKPYFLTPRPDFLHYNPDRQRDNDIENVGMSECSESTDFEDDSDEELDEEKQGVLYKVMKLLFVLCAIFMSTLYISCMKSHEASNLLLLQGYRTVRDSANDFALSGVVLNQTLGKDPTFREAPESVILAKSRIVYDQTHLFNEGEVASDNIDEKREITAETLRLRYVTDIQDLPISMECTDEVLFDEMVTACEATKEEEMDVERQVGTVFNMLHAIGARENLQDAEIGDKTDSSGESANMEGFSYQMDEQRIILGDILSTCEVIDSTRGLGDDQTTRTEALVTDVILAMVVIALLLGGVALLAKTLRLVRGVFTKLSERVPSPVIQECVEPILVEHSCDLLTAKKGESNEEKEQFAVERRLIELCHFRAPTVELLGEYMVSPDFTRISMKRCSPGFSPEVAQQTKRRIFPDSPSVSVSCSNTSPDSNRRFGRDKIVREEEGSTNVYRRSSRIRNKTLSSQL